MDGMQTITLIKDFPKFGKRTATKRRREARLGKPSEHRQAISKENSFIGERDKKE